MVGYYCFRLGSQHPLESMLRPLLEKWVSIINCLMLFYDCVDLDGTFKYFMFYEKGDCNNRTLSYFVTMS